ncbi:hypothetical protein [Psychroflexus halocasei]|uniref:Uncharacterized protein n=1 Tax=Psychroflexus halocasei TaxID=908615 RepID=A0A1H4DEK3_9FLAO|nr:hypothetical protein [Psychroflexus halocasei]SEA70998.1 hypothetical protein SAMN05421540_1112 [Psychroflexus halocasei]
MRYFIFILVLFYPLFGFCQQKKTPYSKKGYKLHLVYENSDNIFNKPIVVINKELEYIVYSLRIPNQNDPSFVLSFTDQDSTDLGWTVKAGNGSDYDFNFFYDSREQEAKFIKEGVYIKNKLSISYLLSSNLEILDKVLEKASKIYILEKTDKPGFKYIAREVEFSSDAKL